jgi:hypothetical protein
MPRRSVDAAVTSCLQSIRAVADDLVQEVGRAQIAHGSGITAMVEHIRRETAAALRLLEKKPPAVRR